MHFAQRGFPEASSGTRFLALHEEQAMIVEFIVHYNTTGVDLVPRPREKNAPVADIRVGIRVKPGASRTRVGGAYAEDELIVAVTARPVDGAANTAVVDALAATLDMRRSDIAIVSGQTARSKVVVLNVDDDDAPRVGAELTRLRAGRP